MEKEHKIKKELDHLEKTYKAGLIKKSEYEDHKNELSNKIQLLQKKKFDEEKHKEFMKDTLGDDIMVAKNTKKNTNDKKEIKDVKETKDSTVNKKSTKSQDSKKVNVKAEKVANNNNNNNKDNLNNNMNNNVADNKSDNDSENINDKEAQTLSQNDIKEDIQESKKDKADKKETSDKKKSSSNSSSSFWSIIILLLILLIAWQSFNFFATDVIPDGNVTIIEYTDFACDYCADVQETLQEVKDIYGDKVTIELRNYPVSKPEISKFAAYAVECIKVTERVQYDYLLQRHFFKKGSQLEKSDLPDFLGLYPIDPDALAECMESEYPKQKVSQDVELAQEDGVTSVPTIIIGDKKIIGVQPFKVYEYHINNELKKQQ